MITDITPEKQCEDIFMEGFTAGQLSMRLKISDHIYYVMRKELHSVCDTEYVFQKVREDIYKRIKL